jgi:hypothetical protein
MASDQIVLDMATQTEGNAAIFTKKDWLSILDNQNKSYNGSQSVIDTSQLANSNKYMNYREAYLTIPMTLALSTNSYVAGAAPVGANAVWNPTSGLCNQAIGLKNWYGSVIHSFTLDYNGTTIIQQTPFIGMWNTFKLMTSLSFEDLRTQGSMIGFYPDNAGNVSQLNPNTFLTNVTAGFSPVGYGTVNNSNGPSIVSLLGGLGGVLNPQPIMDTCDPLNYNSGLLQRQLAWSLDSNIPMGSNAYNATAGNVRALANYPLSSTISDANLNQLWDSKVIQQTDQVAAGGFSTGAGIIQWGILGMVYLKHIHSFFERVPLLKGVFMKLTANFNQTSVQFSMTNASTSATTGTTLTAVDYIPSFCGTANTTTSASAVSVVSPLGGVNPIMVCSAERSNALGAPSGAWPLMLTVPTGSAAGLIPGQGVIGAAATTNTNVRQFTASLSVGQTVLSNAHQPLGTASFNTNPIGGGSVTLNVPAYTFNPVFESSYLSSPVKKIVYTDVYQYQVNGVTGAFNNLITNGIANIKSVLVLPFVSASANGGLSPFLSPFDPAGGGPTSPMVQFLQFNIQISGQNAIYNTERYVYEHFANQFKGCGAINGGQEDGLTSGLVGFAEFMREYCYYYVNCGRMLPVEEAVPKSVNVIGTCANTRPIDMYIFVEYGVEVSVDILTGARV